MKNGQVIATAVLGLFAAVGCGEDDSGDDTGMSQQKLVQCEGINECKGTSECASADGSSSCNGMNECKGQGFVTVEESECLKQMGKVI